MYKTLMAFIAALLIATTPICAEITDHSSTTFTYADDFTFASETRSKTKQWATPCISACEAKLFKAFGAIYAAAGTIIMALAHDHYVTTNKLPSDVHTIAEKYKAKTDAVAGAALTTIGLLVYALTPEPYSNQ